MRIQWLIKRSILWNNRKEELAYELNKQLRDIRKYNSKKGEQQKSNGLGIDYAGRSTSGYQQKKKNLRSKKRWSKFMQMLTTYQP